MQTLKHIISIGMLGLLFIPQLLFASVVPAGALENSIWFSKEPFFEGEHITINALVYNSSAYDLEGTLTFFTGTSTIGAKYFSVIGGASTIINVPWTVIAGSHSFTSVITNPFLTKGGAKMNDTISNVKTKEVRRYADIDTDHDGVGNKIDLDDDNDGLSDILEGKIKTNPLMADTDTDGIPDMSDKEPLVPNILPKPVSTPSKLPESVSEKITEHVPVSVLEKALPIVGGIESYRVHSYADMKGNVRDVTRKIIEQRNSSTSTTAELGNAKTGGWGTLGDGVSTGDIVHSPFAYAKLLFLLVWQFIVGNVYAFYSFIVFCLYALIRIVWSMVP